ncbi:MAG: hypothetical protein M1823_000305 [Watsoniomyces obsoletus]|nr:MAG: hypothetical protein M1823_000305 [Watsoniomyces obsoletus]
MFKASTRSRVITSRSSTSFILTHFADIRPRIGDVEPLTDPANPFHLRAKRRWAESDQSGLSCDIVTTKAVFPKSIVRNHCKRRLRRALITVLEENGLDEKGKSRPGETRWGQPSGKQIVQGNSMIRAQLGTLTTPGWELLEEMRQAVNQLLKGMGFK